MISQALAAHAHQRCVRPHCVFQTICNAIAVPESKLAGIAVQVLLTAVLVNALHAALKDTEIAFNGVRRDGAANVLFCAMVDGLVRCEVVAQVVVLHGFIGVYGGFFGDVRLQDRQQCLDFQIIDNDGLGAARGAVNQRQNFHLVANATAHRLVRFTTNEGFVNFNNATTSTERAKGVVAHCFPDAVRHEPSGSQRDAQGAVQLVAADALLAGTDQIDRLQPQVHGNVAGLKDCAYLDGEGLAALVALVSANAGGLAAHLADPLHAAAMRAHRAISPDARLYISVGGFFIVELGAGKDGHGAYSLACPLYLGFLRGYVKYNIANGNANANANANAT